MSAKCTTYLLVAMTLAAALFLLGGAVTHVAAGGCGQPYEVQPGDTLSAIAQRFGTSVWELVRLNRIANPDLIYVGQVLCLPVQAPPPTPEAVAATPTPEAVVTVPVAKVEQAVAMQAPSPQVVIEATYIYSPTMAEEEWEETAPPGKRIGMRAVFPLAPEAIEPVEDSADLKDAVGDDVSPIFWIAKQDANNYVLVSVGEEEHLAALRLDEPEAVPPLVLAPEPDECPPTLDLAQPETFTQTIGGPGTNVESITVWLEAPQSAHRVRRVCSLTIGQISHARTLEEADRCFSPGYLALIPQGEGTYRLVFVLSEDVLTEDVFGPAGLSREARCQRWLRVGGWYYRWLRAILGCPR